MFSCSAKLGRGSDRVIALALISLLLLEMEGVIRGGYQFGSQSNNASVMTSSNSDIIVIFNLVMLPKQSL